MNETRKTDWRDSLPFPAHWLYIIIAKFVFLGLVTVIALYWYGLI